MEESVIGAILEKHGENYVVDIGGPFSAALPVLAFEGATRRNRPNLQVRVSSKELAPAACSIAHVPNRKPVAAGLCTLRSCTIYVYNVLPQLDTT